MHNAAVLPPPTPNTSVRCTGDDEASLAHVHAYVSTYTYSLTHSRTYYFLLKARLDALEQAPTADRPQVI